MLLQTSKVDQLQASQQILSNALVNIHKGQENIMEALKVMAKANTGGGAAIDTTKFTVPKINVPVSRRTSVASSKHSTGSPDTSRKSSTTKKKPKLTQEQQIQQLVKEMISPTRRWLDTNWSDYRMNRKGQFPQLSGQNWKPIFEEFVKFVNAKGILRPMRDHEDQRPIYDDWQKYTSDATDNDDPSDNDNENLHKILTLAMHRNLANEAAKQRRKAKTPDPQENLEEPRTTRAQRKKDVSTGGEQSGESSRSLFPPKDTTGKSGKSGKAKAKTPGGDTPGFEDIDDV